MELRLKNKKNIFPASSRLFVVVVISLILSACVDEFTPKLKDTSPLLVIDGSIILGLEVQKVYVSRTTTLENPEFIPVSQCEVKVIDKMGQEFTFQETISGLYECEIPEQSLAINREYQLYVKTQSNEYISEFEPILESSPVDSVYYLSESNQTSGTQYDNGLQFYTDLKAPEGATTNYRWVLEETWEINTGNDIDGYWNKNATEVPEYAPIKDTLNVCWSTSRINDIYTSSTQNLSINEKKKIPLNYLPGTDPKSKIMYSVLVKQYALSDESYQYWSQNQTASGSSGGLYQQQPSQSKSNIHNINNPEEVVLGFFWASSYSEKRIFYDGPLGVVFEECDTVLCIPQIGQSLLQYFQGLDKSVYLLALEFSSNPSDSVTLWGYTYNQVCTDCTADGGTMEKPDFWP